MCPYHHHHHHHHHQYHVPAGEVSCSTTFVVCDAEKFVFFMLTTFRMTFFVGKHRDLPCRTLSSRVKKGSTKFGHCLPSICRYTAGFGEGESAEKLQKQMGRLANQQRAKANWELLSAELDVSLRSLPWDCRLSDWHRGRCMS